MNEAETTQAELDRKALEAFRVGNKDLERLKALLDQFNIFEAIGVVRQELRHSDFLAFLIGPQENHDLDDVFVKRLLQRVIKDAEQDSLPLTPIELELSNLDQMTVLREWQHIDVLLLDEPNLLAIVIENKIGTGEHSDQLQRYYRTVSQCYPDYRIVGLYLTPFGEEPSHEAYLSVSYGLVCEVLDDLIESRASVLNADLQTLVTHSDVHVG